MDVQLSFQISLETERFLCDRLLDQNRPISERFRVLFSPRKGMRIVQSPKDFDDSFIGAQREAAASFGINTILLELI